MSYYQIECKAGIVYGIYPGNTAEQAFIAMLMESGQSEPDKTSGTAADWHIKELSALRKDAMQHAESCLTACGGWTVETLGHNIESAFGGQLDEDECDYLASEALQREQANAR